MVFLAINLSRTIANFAWGTLILIVFIILYRLLIRRMKKGRMSTEGFLVLHSLEEDPARGEVKFYMELSNDMHVKLTIYDTANTMQRIVRDELLTKGGNIIPFDTAQLENGTYYYEAKTDVQKTSKKFEIKN